MNEVNSINIKSLLKELDGETVAKINEKIERWINNERKVSGYKPTNHEINYKTREIIRETTKVQ